MSGMPVVVLDPGHGGARGTRNGGSSWNRAEGPNGLLEKNVTFDLALRVAARLRDHARVELTRSEQANPTLAERAGVARRNDAALFVSLHLNGASDPETDGTSVYFAHDANATARAFGQSLLQRLRSVTGTTRGGLAARDLGTLVTSRHSPRTAAVLAEIAYLSNPRQARALSEEAYRNQLADALSETIREQLSQPAALVQELAAGDGSPFVGEAVTQCWERCERLRLGASGTSAPNRLAAQRIRTATGVVVDANPYAGISKNEIEAIVRACFTSHAMPEVLLAIWAKEGSTRSITSAVRMPQATSDANARALFRSKVYYEDLGADHFLVTTRSASGGDNRFDSTDSAAAGHETHFAGRVAQLVTDGFLREDIAGAINSELTVTNGSSGRSVTPSTRFYALSLLLVDALWEKFKAASRPLLPLISDPMNYMQWNMGAASFDTFLRSAETHRNEPAHRVNGEPRTIEEWALRTTPRANEYRQARINAIKFGHYIECYREIFEPTINLIKPGIEDLRETRSRAAEIEVSETLAITTFPNSELFTPPQEWKEMPIEIDTYAGAFGTATVTRRRLVTVADVRAHSPGFALVPDPSGPNKFFFLENSDRFLDDFLFRGNAAGKVEASLESVICYPSDPAHPGTLARHTRRFPVAIVIHGNISPVVTSRTVTPVGAPITVPILGTVITPARRVAGGASPISHNGFSAASGAAHLQEELARIGFVSMSINTNGANEHNLNVDMRAAYVLKYLDQLRTFAATAGNRFHNKLDFNRVALIGHSRGGDAVVSAVHLNLTRGAARRFGIKSVVSVSPTDITGILGGTGPKAVEIRHNAHYLVLYGSHDGDVRGGGDGAHGRFGTGFRLYDRSNAHRGFVFLHAANHNRFNQAWADESNTAIPAASMTRAQQVTLLNEYVGGWLRWTMLNDFPEANLFNGTNANSLSKPVSLMWKFGRNLKTIERYQDAVDTTNTLGGAVTKPSYVSEVRIDNDNPPDAAAGAGILFPRFPHVDRVSKAVVPVAPAAPLRHTLPAAHQNFLDFTHLTFRVTKLYPVTGTAAISSANFPDFSITLEDTAGHRKTIANADILTENARKEKPYFRLFTDLGIPSRNITKCNFETWRVPLTRFTSGSGPVSLNAIRAVEFNFAAVAGEPVYVDTISLVKL